MSRYPENYYDTESGLPTTVNNVTTDKIWFNDLKAPVQDMYGDFHIDQNVAENFSNWQALSAVLTTTDSLINNSTGILSQMTNGEFTVPNQEWFLSVNHITVNRLVRRLGFINKLLYRFQQQTTAYIADSINAPAIGRYPEGYNELWDTQQKFGTPENAE